eukprot:2460204-Rhodomonas_salina.1
MEAQVSHLLREINGFDLPSQYSLYREPSSTELGHAPTAESCTGLGHSLRLYFVLSGGSVVPGHRRACTCSEASPRALRASACGAYAMAGTKTLVLITYYDSGANHTQELRNCCET